MAKNRLETLPKKSTEYDLNKILTNAEIDVISKCEPNPSLPICFIIGAPRSGATLLFQWLAASNAFCFPSNLITRFYMTPCIGAGIQKMLSSLDSVMEGDVNFGKINGGSRFKSIRGKTTGLFSPNEFIPFWQRFFYLEGISENGLKNQIKTDWLILNAELAAFESVNKKPIVVKAGVLNGHILSLFKYIPNAIFLYIKREPFYNIQSLFLQIRTLKSLNEKWQTYKPPEQNKLNNLNIYKKVSGQIHFTNRVIEKGINKIPDKQKIIINYEDICFDPVNIWTELNNRFNKLGFTLHKKYDGSDSFENTNRQIVDQKDADRIAAAYYSLFGDDIKPK